MRPLRSMMSGLFGAALALCLCVVVLSGALYLCGTNAPLMGRMMLAFAPPDATALPEAHYAPMADMITGYLSGRVAEFQYTLSGADRTLALFHGYEQLHMADCRALFTLCRRVLISAAVLAAVLAVALLFLRRPRACAAGFLLGTAAALLAAAVLGIAAVIDFDGVFILFHRLSFSNDMWMLDPRTDLLIRLMPLDFFIHYVLFIGIAWLGSMLGMLAASVLALRRAARKRRR